jgi:hypothetical protein
VHPLAQTFPELSADEFQELVADMKAHGQREPITLYEGQIVDGVHRARACVALGVTPMVREWKGPGGLAEYVVSLNLLRRHLTPSQRATLAARVLATEQRDRAGNGPRSVPRDAASGRVQGSTKGAVGRVAELADVDRKTARKAVAATVRATTAAVVRAVRRKVRTRMKRGVPGPPAIPRGDAVQSWQLGTSGKHITDLIIASHGLAMHAKPLHPCCRQRADDVLKIIRRLTTWRERE